jgi:hypothetical protein
VVSGRVVVDASQPLNALDVLGLGFVASAIILFAISQGLGLIEANVSGPSDRDRRGRFRNRGTMIRSLMFVT